MINNNRDIPLFIGDNVKKVLPSRFITDDNMKNTPSFRIPSLITAKDGTVIAAADRASTGMDWGKIDIAVRISTDNGDSFSEMNILTNCPTRKPVKSENDTGSAFAIDPVMTVCENGDILLMFDFWPECKGLHDRSILENTNGYVEIGGMNYLALFDANTDFEHVRSKDTATGYSCHTLRGDGFVYDPNGNRTNFYMPRKHLCYEDGYGTMGDLYYAVGEPDYLDNPPPLIPKEPGELDDIYVGNIYLNVAQPPLNEKNYFVQKYVADENTEEPFDSAYPVLLTKPAPLRAAITSFIWCMRSCDNGRTWSTPYDINAYVKRPQDEGFFGVAPGNGLRLRYQKNARYNGRILVPVYNLNAAAVIYSDDNGLSWYRNEKEYIRLVGENQLFEFADGFITAVSRPTWVSTPRTVFSTDGGYSWSNNGEVLKIACVHCQKAIITLPPVGGKQYVIASHSTGHFGKDDSRSAGVITVGLAKMRSHTVKWISEINAKERAYYSDFHDLDDFFAYSSITALADGSIGLLYEALPSGYILFRKFSMDELFIGSKPAKAKKSGS